LGGFGVCDFLLFGCLGRGLRGGSRLGSVWLFGRVCWGNRLGRIWFLGRVSRTRLAGVRLVLGRGRLVGIGF
jgi:hypothetical protein